jgi:DNA helicase-2/ATP-dependent DNA helicase PcrA
MIGMEDGVFPHIRSLGEPDELEEERRLCYVGITRAMRRLYLTHAWSRTLWGATQYNPPSRFLREIPEHLVEAAEGSREVRPRPSRGPLGWRSAPRDPATIGRNRDEIVERAMASSTSPTVTTGAEALGLRIGDDVRHSKWGEGVIIDISGQGDKAEATVRFPGQGEKRLLLSWAPLEKVRG